MLASRTQVESLFRMHSDRAMSAAREEAVKAIPTEYGFFDARARVEAFVRELENWGFIVVPEWGRTKTDEEIDELLEEWGIDS